MLPRYINPYIDFGFKKLFGEESNKDLLVDFLNSVLPEEYQVSQLFFNNPEQLPNNIVDRKAIFDISCTGEHDESFTVEMQKAKQLGISNNWISCNISVEFLFYRHLYLVIFDLIALKGQYRLARRIAAGYISPKLERPVRAIH